MIFSPLKRAFGMASGLYAATGYYVGMAIYSHDFLDLKAEAHHSWLYRRMGQTWNKARQPLQSAIHNKLTDSALKSDFSPRPVGDVMKRMAPSLLNMAITTMPKLLSSPNTLMAVAMACIFLLEDTTRQYVMDQTSQLAALFNAQTGDTTQQLQQRESRKEKPSMTGVPPSIS